MKDDFDAIALQAAVNILRDSAETGRMPSGEPLAPEAADLHRQAADHLAERRHRPGVPQDGASFSDEEREVRLSCRLTPAEAWNLAQFVKRVGFSDLRSNAEDDDEAYGMRDAIDRVRRALADVGYAPR